MTDDGGIEIVQNSISEIVDAEVPSVESKDFHFQYTVEAGYKYTGI